jgi:hypothetical protein
MPFQLACSCLPLCPGSWPTACFQWHHHLGSPRGVQGAPALGPGGKVCAAQECAWASARGLQQA